MLGRPYTPSKSVFSGRSKMLLTVVIVLICTFLGGAVFVYTQTLPPVVYVETNNFVIDEGISHARIAAKLQEEGIIRSASLFKVLHRIHFPDTHIQAGVYTLTSEYNVQEILRILVAGDYRIPLHAVTFPEGFKIADFRKYAPEFDTPTDTTIRELEGYLFPDTYYIASSTNSASLIKLMQENFQRKIQPLQAQIQASGFTERDVIILASIIEREAKDTTSKKLVSGVFRNRLKENMPLQADATLNYVFDRTSEELTQDDLQSDNPYNSYRFRGLPPTPIANPGMEAILAVLEPTESDYYFYLTAPDGTFYYAETFEEHKLNKARYLR